MATVGVKVLTLHIN